MRRLMQLLQFRLAVLTMVWAPPAVVEAQYNYTANNGAITITGYTGPGGPVTIPATINGLPVTGIGDRAFAGSGLTSVTIPPSVTSIGEEPFTGCTGLSAIYVYALNSFYSSGDGVLFNRDRTMLICCPEGRQGGTYTIPNSVTNIADWAFEHCADLNRFIIPSSVISIGREAFYACSSLNSVTIPGTVTSIGDYAFGGCSSLSSIYFLGNAPVFGMSVFAQDVATVYYSLGTTGFGSALGNLTSTFWDPGLQMTFTTNNGAVTITGYTGAGALTVPSTIDGLPVTSIASLAPSGRDLTGVTIPNSVTSIGRVFQLCGNLTNVTLGNGVTTIGSSAFEWCTNLASVTMGNAVTSIGDYAFVDCGRLTDVTLPNTVTNIGMYAFGGCASLPRLTIPNGVSSITTSAFSSCASLTSVTIPNSVTSIGDWAFSNCAGLTSVTVPDRVTSIGDYAFVNCVRLSSVTIPNSVTRVGTVAFLGCQSLTNVTIGDSVISIRDRTFYGCSNLTSVTIPNSVTTIGYQAFLYCGLTNVTIRSSATGLAVEAFRDCAGLTSVYFEGNAPGPSTDLSVFSGDDNAIVYYLAGTTGWDSTFDGLPTVPWNPQVQTRGGGFGVRTNQFGFTITGASNLVVVVEASADLTNPTWSPILTNTLTGASFYFSDPQWTNYHTRFYRLGWP